MDSPQEGSISEQPLASGMDGEDRLSPYSNSVGRELVSPVDWQSLSILNGRNYFIIVHDIAGCERCWSCSTHYNILGQDDELLMSGKRLFSLPGCKPSNIYVSDLNNSNMFSVKFITCGCFPTLKRIEVWDNWKKRIGTVACSSKVFTFISFVIKNELEGASFRVKSAILPSWDYEIQKWEDGQMVATVVRHGPAHVLKMEEDSLVSCCNKALFLALCLFLDTRRRYCTT